MEPYWHNGLRIRWVPGFSSIFNLMRFIHQEEQKTGYQPWNYRRFYPLGGWEIRLFEQNFPHLQIRVCILNGDFIWLIRHR